MRDHKSAGPPVFFASSQLLGALLTIWFVGLKSVFKATVPETPSASVASPPSLWGPNTSTPLHLCVLSQTCRCSFNSNIKVISILLFTFITRDHDTFGKPQGYSGALTRKNHGLWGRDVTNDKRNIGPQSVHMIPFAQISDKNWL